MCGLSRASDVPADSRQKGQVSWVESGGPRRLVLCIPRVHLCPTATDKGSPLPCDPSEPHPSARGQDRPVGEGELLQWRPACH